MSSSIVIALPKIEDAKKIRTILNRHGLTVASVCSSVSNALANISELDSGVLICGYKLTDAYYKDALDDLPQYFEMLLLASQRIIDEAPNSVSTVQMPMKASALIDTVNDMLYHLERRIKKEKKKWERAVYNASCFVTCSEYSKSMIEETLNLPCSKVVSIPWGISSDFNKVSPAILSECKTRLNLPSRYFLSVSCSHPRKNIETLIKAFIQFNSKKREHKLVLVWSNPPKSILNLCQKNIENSDIIFLKYISDKDLVSVYNGATATFFPTRYEGFGFPILESFACNTPVVTCRNTSLPEVGGNIALYTDEDGVDEMSYYMELFENENFDLHLFREQAKNYIKRFSWENTALQYVELYKSLL